MGNEVASVAPNNNAIAVPENLAAAFGGVESNINLGEMTPHLSIKGKVWKMVVEGNEKVLMTKVDGEPTPMPTVKVIILNQVPKRSRAYFKGDYVEGEKTQPECWSINGDTPSIDVDKPLSKSCNTCPMAVKGSKITADQKQTTACGTNKRICVIPSTNGDFKALLLKLPVTSLWESEGSEEAQGWFAFDSYLKYLKSNNVTHTAMVETTMKFDSKDVSYPKVLFKYNGFIDEETMAKVVPRLESEEVLHVLGLDEEIPTAEILEAKMASAPVEEAQEVKAEAKAEVVVEDDSGFGEAEEEVEVKTAPKKKTVKRKAKAKKAEPAVEVSEDAALADALSDWE